MQVGFLHEGDYDSCVGILVERIVCEHLKEKVELEKKYFSAEGGIIGKLEQAIALFFESPSCDFAVFLTDNDSKKNKCKEVRDRLKIINPNNELPIALGCIQPHFEKWFVDESDAIKTLLGLPGESSLYINQGLDPKGLTTSLFRFNNKDETRSLKDFYEELVNKMDLRKLRTINREFSAFEGEIKTAVNQSLRTGQ